MGVAVHKGYSFVQFETNQEASKAIEKENGSMFLGKRIDVKTAKRGPPKSQNSEYSEEQQEFTKQQQAQDQDYNNQNYNNQNYNHYNEDFRGRGRGRGGGRGYRGTTHFYPSRN